MIGQTVSHYKILEKLGEGGMGVVYRAQDTKLNREAALKFLPSYLASEPLQKERFFHEAQAASALNHPNVTTIYEIDTHYDQIFIAMELVEGKTLKQLIKAETLSIKKVLEIAIQVCDGLTAAAEKSIVHRDIKSDNIILTPKWQVKIMDFGLAKFKGAEKLTQAGSTVGTAAYMSPEQATGEEVDHRADIFSFGVVLYELLTGHLPFRGEHPAGYAYSILNEEPLPLARYNDRVTPELQRMVSKALAKEKAERYQHIDELGADLRRERKSLEYATSATIPKSEAAHKPKKILKVLVPSSAAAVLVLLFFLFNPFKVEVTRDRSAEAAENSLAVIYFNNVADPEDKDKTAQMITSLLITDLSESEYMRVVSRQRLYDILNLMGKGDVKVIDRKLASEVAKKAGVKWILTGEVIQAKPNLVVTAEVSEAANGKILAAQKVTGGPNEDLFAVVDKLSAEVKKDLTLPEQAKREVEKSVAEVTTHSPEAYRHYLEGLDNSNKYYFTEAEKSFRKAIELDSTFAMAYYRLAVLVDGAEGKKYIAQAVKYSDKVSQKEKYYIKARELSFAGDTLKRIEQILAITKRYPDEKEAFYLLGNWYRNRKPQEAIRFYNKTIEIDPLYKPAYNLLAYAYNDLGDFEKSIWAINKYIEIAPDEANPYDTRGDLYAWNGKLDEAIGSYQKALKVKPDFYASLEKLGNMYLFKREYAKAESCYRELCVSNDKGSRADGRTLLAQTPLYRGQFRKALEVLDQGIAADRMEQVEGWNLASKYSHKVEAYEATRNYPLALRELELAQEILDKSSPDDPVGQRGYLVEILAKNGNFTKADSVARALKKRIEKKAPDQMYVYWAAMGFIERARGNKTAAVGYYEKAAKQAPAEFWLRYLLAEAYFEAGNLSEAVSVLEKALLRYDGSRAWENFKGVMAHYLLAQAYEKSGWNPKAIEKYQEFLEIWKEADPGIVEVEDAKRRLARLKGKV